jgi:flavin reductase (DIM6/NTAB) family NADH-FMN oxidoreductase RutF
MLEFLPEEFKLVGEGNGAMFHRLFYPRQVVLVSAANKDRANVTAVEWITPVSEKPPALAISLLNTSLTLELICASGEFVVAIPAEKMKDAVLLCGTTSGKFIDKFAEAALTQVKARKVGAPLILEAAANIECRMLSYASAGERTLVTGEVVEVHLPKDERALPGAIFDRGEKRLFFLLDEEGK